MDIVSKRYKQLSYEYHSVTRKDDQKEDNDNSDAASCRVCLEKYGDEWKTSKWVMKGCGHSACGNCLDRILADAHYGQCPHCRKSFTIQDMIRIHE
ncbi:Oidioi.mRNA.OKI2018_I69.chr2.g7231.t1.cds [Oikopleura dioica]|uniref:Oidioi.mRNA.OKI2018_I69.chr2.g7231.t1.cds n=1 Tax=Oikopleura dioica TaxID=34765 RepID=A0ABN7T5Z1_OIKDI|nr:Oidioi.mRNA.OKI2018_I69.chr2.g7231.t1.cds [Oikopleura dioica]